MRIPSKAEMITGFQALVASLEEEVAAAQEDIDDYDAVTAGAPVVPVFIGLGECESFVGIIDCPLHGKEINCLRNWSEATAFSPEEAMDVVAKVRNTAPQNSYVQTATITEYKLAARKFIERSEERLNTFRKVLLELEKL